MTICFAFRVVLVLWKVTGQQLDVIIQPFGKVHANYSNPTYI
jgi:hypothetical protein